MHQVSECPICTGSTFTKFLNCQDFTVSHETFTIVTCDSCGLKLTNPRPDTNSLARYYISDSYISHSDQSKTLIDKIYKQAREWALSWKLTQVKKFEQGASFSVLDFGCGTGYFLERCKQNKIRIAGVEPSPSARGQATIRTQTEIKSNITEINSSFDVITLWHVLEHVAELNETIDQLKSRLNKNGTMFIAVPNHLSHDAKKYRQHWAGYDVPRHLWHFEEKTMKSLLTKHALKVIDLIPMKLDSFYVSMLSENYETGKKSFSNIARGLAEGLRSNIAADTNTYSSTIYVAKAQ